MLTFDDISNAKINDETMTLAQALCSVAAQWEQGKQFPEWINLDECELEQFYTRKERAFDLFEDLRHFLENKDISINDCLFIEPSAGTGAFLSALPKDFIAMDIEPKAPLIERCDFLTWNALSDTRILSARDKNKTIVCIGNPPFGNRGWMALSFLNKCTSFADYCAFILPMSFASEGKGSPKYRVRDMRVAKSEELQKEGFDLPDEKTRKLNVVWQIWERGENKRDDFSAIDEKFEIHFCCDLSYRTCGQEFKKMADAFVPQACFPGTPMIIETQWENVLYESAYGVKAKDSKDTDALLRALRETDWQKHSTLATHGCRHIGMTEIKRALAEAFELIDQR